MEWLKAILEGKGIEATDELLADVSKELPKHFIPKAEYNKKKSEAEALQKKLDEAPDAGELQTKLDELQAKYDTDTAALSDKLNGAERSYAIDMALSKSGARSTKALKALLDDGKIEYKDGALSGLDEQIESVKKEHGYLFESAKDTSLPLGGGGGDAGDKFMAAMRSGAGLPKETQT